MSRIRDILRTSHILPLTRIRGSTIYYNYIIRGNQQAPYEGIASCSGDLRATCIIWEYARCENIIYFTVNLLKYWIACYHLAAAMSHNYVHCKKGDSLRKWDAYMWIQDCAPHTGEIESNSRHLLREPVHSGNNAILDGANVRDQNWSTPICGESAEWCKFAAILLVLPVIGCWKKSEQG